MEQLSVMRTMLLLSTTHRKLYLEEPIADSSSPLKALQLAQMAVKLNHHLHDEETARNRPISHSSWRSHRSHMQETIIAESEDEEDEEDINWAHGLAQMESAIEVGTAQREERDSVVELLDDKESEKTSNDTQAFSASAYEMEYEDFDDDDDDMPMLSRQTSNVFNGSSSSSTDDEEEESETEYVESFESEDDAVDHDKDEAERVKQHFYQRCSVPVSAFQLSAHGEQQYRPAILHAVPLMAAAVA
jgi:hypothetical protein